jgi:hypothetical protein
MARFLEGNKVGAIEKHTQKNKRQLYRAQAIVVPFCFLLTIIVVPFEQECNVCTGKFNENIKMLLPNNN